MSNELKNLELVNEMLTLSDNYNLNAEVVLSAINLAKQYPSASVACVISQALTIWDCYPVVDDLPF
jgi:UDP-N-acetylmuramyl pentapeptide synthase